VADAPASLREVAAHAGVSVGTVSNVLNRPDIVAEPTRSRVGEAIKQLGFIRNESARQLRARQRPTAVFCANDLLALGVLQEMTANRIRVPEDISLIGYDDIDSPRPRPCCSRRCASRANCSAAPRRNCCSTRRSGRARTSTGRWCSSRNWWCAGPARPGPGTVADPCGSRCS